MNSFSLFARKKIGRSLGLTQRDASNLFHRQEQHDCGGQSVNGEKIERRNE